MHMSTGGILQGRIKLQPPGKHIFEDSQVGSPKKKSKLPICSGKIRFFLSSKTIKTINPWDAPKSIEGTCQHWLQLLTGGITQDALHMHSATVALVAAPAIRCLHLNMLHVQNIDSVKMHIEVSYVFGPFFSVRFSKSRSRQGWAKGPDNPQGVDSPEGWTLAKSWAANCLSEGKTPYAFVKIQKRHERLTSPNDPSDYMHVFWCIFTMSK